MQNKADQLLERTMGILEQLMANKTPDDTEVTRLYNDIGEHLDGMDPEMN